MADQTPLVYLAERLISTMKRYNEQTHVVLNHYKIPELKDLIAEAVNSTKSKSKFPVSLKPIIIQVRTQSKPNIGYYDNNSDLWIIKSHSHTYKSADIERWWYLPGKETSVEMIEFPPHNKKILILYKSSETPVAGYYDSEKQKWVTDYGARWTTDNVKEWYDFPKQGAGTSVS